MEWTLWHQNLCISSWMVINHQTFIREIVAVHADQACARLRCQLHVWRIQAVQDAEKHRWWQLSQWGMLRKASNQPFLLWFYIIFLRNWVFFKSSRQELKIVPLLYYANRITSTFNSISISAAENIWNDASSSNGRNDIIWWLFWKKKTCITLRKVW